MDHNYMNLNETESPVKDLQNLDQRQAEDNNPEQKSAQESGHYWWCPVFGHLPNCQYLNFGFQDMNYLSPPMMANPYSMPYIQIPNNCDQNMIADPSPRIRTVTAKKSPKTSGTEIERLYSCRLCDKLSETKDIKTLRKHIEDHLGKVRPYLCRVCGKQFKFRSNCRNHVIAHSVVRKNIRRLSSALIQS